MFLFGKISFWLIFSICYGHQVIKLWELVWSFRWEMNCKSCFFNSQEEDHSEWKTMSYLTGQNPECRGAAGVHTLPLSSEGNTAHGFAPLSPLTPPFSQGLILFIAHVLRQKPFQGESPKQSLFQSCFLAAPGPLTHRRNEIFQDVKAKEEVKHAESPCLAQTWHDQDFYHFLCHLQLQTFHSEMLPSDNILRGKLTTVHPSCTPWLKRGFLMDLPFFMWCYFVTHNGLMKIKSWCSTGTALPLSQSF